MDLRPDGLRHVSANDLKQGDLFVMEHKGATLLCLHGTSDRMGINLVLAALSGAASDPTPFVVESRAITFLDAWLVEDAMIEPAHFLGLAPSPTFTAVSGALAYEPGGEGGVCVGVPNQPERFEVINVKTGAGGKLHPEARFYESWRVTVPGRNSNRRILYERLVKPAPPASS